MSAFPLNLDFLGLPAAQYGPGGGWGSHMYYGMGTGMGWLGGPFMIIFWILLIVAGVALIKWLFASSRRESPVMSSGAAPDRSLAILKERFAKGEIDAEQFKAMKQELEQ